MTQSERIWSLFFLWQIILSPESWFSFDSFDFILFSWFDAVSHFHWFHSIRWDAHDDDDHSRNDLMALWIPGMRMMMMMIRIISISLIPSWSILFRSGTLCCDFSSSTCLESPLSLIFTLWIRSIEIPLYSSHLLILLPSRFIRSHIWFFLKRIGIIWGEKRGIRCQQKWAVGVGEKSTEEWEEGKKFWRHKRSHRNGMKEFISQKNFFRMCCISSPLSSFESFRGRKDDSGVKKDPTQNPWCG